MNFVNPEESNLFSDMEDLKNERYFNRSYWSTLDDGYQGYDYEPIAMTDEDSRTSKPTSWATSMDRKKLFKACLLLLLAAVMMAGFYKGGVAGLFLWPYHTCRSVFLGTGWFVKAKSLVGLAKLGFLPKLLGGFGVGVYWLGALLVAGYVASE
jgi:hypothetical protein